MTSTRARWGVWLLTVTVCTSFTPRIGAAGVPIVILFDGGNAFVQSITAPNQMTVGAIAAQSPAHHYNLHRMRLMVNDGAVDRSSTTLPPVTLGTNQAYWDLYGWSIEICPGGICPKAGTLSTSPLKVSQGDCQDATDNLALIPDFWALHQAVPIADGWRDKLDSELALRAGTLSVTGGANCFELRGPNGASVVRNVAVGPKEIRWMLDGNQNPYDFVDLVFKPKFGIGTSRRARLRAGTSGIELWAWTLAPSSAYPTVSTGDVIPHFQQFYSLFDERAVPASERYAMYARKVLGGVSPGTECPPAMLIAP